jgi:uncharacterized protein (TIGR02246 family)
MNKKIVFSLIVFLVIVVGQMNLGSARQVILQEIVERQAKAWQTGDAFGIVHDFAPNALFIAGDYTFEGTEAIKQAANDYFRQFTDTKITIKRVIIEKNQGAVEWSWSDRNIKTGKASQAEDAIIFELQADGKIIYWREYIQTIRG